MMITITNGLTVVAFLVFLLFVYFIAKEGNDERATFLKFKLFSFLFTFLLSGLALIILYTGWVPLNYVMLRVSITSLMSLTVIVGFLYWLILRKKF